MPACQSNPDKIHTHENPVDIDYGLAAGGLRIEELFY
jgi:hypothetical protein